MKKQNAQLREEVKRQAADLATAQRDQGDAELKVQTLSQQVDRLKSLVENLDSNKEELIKRLQMASQDKNDEVSDKAILQNDIANYKREMIAKDSQIH